MKRKWLISLATAAMVVTLSVGFAACGKDNSEQNLETVTFMIETLNDLYESKSPLTPISYTVKNSILADGKQQPVKWSVEAVTEGITLSDYVVVGAVDKANNDVTIEIKDTSKVIDYKLIATVTVGKATDSVTYERQIPHVYTVAGIEEFGANIASGSYYEEDGVKTPFIVSGYVVKRGTFETGYKNWNDVYIADTADAAAEYPAAMQVYRLEVDGEVLKEDGDLVVGAKILVHGWLQNFSGKLQLTHDASAPSGKSGNNPTAIQITPPELTDQEKVDLAKGMLTLPKTVYAKAGESVDLETSIAGAAVTWAVTSGEGATITGSTLKIASPLPSTPQEVVLTATIKAGAVTDTKTFTIQVGLSRTAPSTQENPYSVAEAKEFATTIANLDYSGRVFVKGYVVKAGSFSSNTWTNVYIADEKGESDTAKQFQVYKMSTNDILTQESELVVGDQVILSGFIQNFNGTYELTYNNQASDGDKNTYCVWTNNENAGQGGGSTEIQDGFTPMEQPTEGEFYYAAVKGSERLYVSDNTQLDSDTQGYLKTTNDPAQAVKLKLEKKAGSETDWYIKMGEKYLEVLPYQSSGKTYTSYKLQLVASPTAVWTWLADARCFQQMVTPIAEEDKTPIGIYVGTYNSSNYTTLSPSTVSRITGDNVGDLDVSQHPARFGTLAELGAAEKLAAAVSALDLTKKSFTEIDQTVTLPTTGLHDTAIAWTVSEEVTAKYFNYDNATHTLTVKALPTFSEGDATVTITASVSIDGVNDPTTKQFTLTLVAPIEQAEGTLLLTPESVWGTESKSGYAGHNGTYSVEGYQVTTSNMMKSDSYFSGTSYPFGFTVLQFKKTDGYLTVTGNFTKIMFVMVTDTAYDSLGTKILTVTAGGNALEVASHSTKDGITVINGTPWYGHTVEYNVTGGEQEIKIQAGSGAAYLRYIILTEHEITDQEREAAIDAELVKVTGVSIETLGDKALPASGDENVTFTWAVKQADGNAFPENIALATDKITVTALPEEETTVILVLTATYKESEVSKDKEVTVTISAAHATDEEKAAAALKSLDYSAFKNSVYSEVNAEGVQLPQTSATVTQYEATVTWSVEGEPNEYVSISANKLCINQLPTDADKTITLKVTVSVNGKSATDTITITVKKAPDPNHKEGTYTITESSVTDFTNAYNSYEWSVTDSNGDLKGKLFAYKSGCIQFNGSQSGCSIVNTVATPGPIVSVKITTQTGGNERSWKLFTNSSPYSETDKKPTAGTDHGAQTAKTTGTTWAVSDANAYFFALVEQDTSASKIDSIEITYSGTPMTDEVKATAALNAITFEETELKEDVTLPTSVIEGVTFTWTTENGGEAAKVENNTTLKIVRQDADVDFTLKVTATSGEYTTQEAKSIPLKVLAKPAEGQKEVTLLYTLTPENGTGNSNYASSGTATIDGIEWTAEANMGLSGPAWGFGGKNLTKVDRKLTSSTALSGTVKKLIITFGQASNVTINSATLKVYSSDPLGESPTLVSTVDFTVTPNNKVTVEAPADSDWTNSYFQIIFNVTIGSSNKRIDLKGIEFHGYAAD